VLVLSIGVKNHDEQGLLGLALSPDFATSGRFYVNYIDGASNTVVARYTRGGDAGSTGASRQQLMYLEQWQPNHNGYVCRHCACMHAVCMCVCVCTSVQLVSTTVMQSALVKGDSVA
jgi:hypothetical protein